MTKKVNSKQMIKILKNENPDVRVAWQCYWNSGNLYILGRWIRNWNYSLIGKFKEINFWLLREYKNIT